MKNLKYVPLAFLALVPVSAFAHRVPYGGATCAVDEEQAAYEGIPLCTEEEKEKSSATAYCKFMSHPNLANCVEGITSHGLAEAAGKCADRALQRQVDIRDELVGHKTGGAPSTSDGYWHLEYRYSKEDGWHRHDWGVTARDKAGREYGITAVRQAKEASAVNKKTDGKTKSIGVGGSFKAAIGLGPAASVDHEVNANHTSGNNSEVESGPLSQADIDKAYDEGYSIGYTNPNLTDVGPDILCEKNKPKCGSSFSRDIINEDYYESQGGNAATDNKSNGGSNVKPSGSTSGSQSGGSKNPTPPPGKSTAETDVIDYTPAGSYAGDPAPVTKPGEMIASYDQDALINSPISQCLMEELKEQVSKDMNKRYDPNGPNLTPGQRRKEAQGLLRQGICDAKFYGSLYCQKYKIMKLTGNMVQDPQQPDKTTLFEQLQELGKYNFGNPADYEDKTPIDFNRLPKGPMASPDAPATKPIALPGRK